MEAPPSNDCCSICHDDFTLACQANCSHWFCGACILRVWQHGSVLQACKCPICRRTISLLIPCEAALRQRYQPEAGQVIEEVEKYNRSFGGGSLSLVQRIHDMPFLLKRLMRELLDPHRSLPLVFKARMIFSVLVSAIYVISPVDILPEGILGIIGLLDDCLIVMMFSFIFVPFTVRHFCPGMEGHDHTLSWDIGYLLYNISFQVCTL